MRINFQRRAFLKLQIITEDVDISVFWATEAGVKRKLEDLRGEDKRRGLRYSAAAGGRAGKVPRRFRIISIGIGN